MLPPLRGVMHPDEARDLWRVVTSVTEYGVVVDDEKLVNWKRNRGMLSAEAMSRPRKREAWLAVARVVARAAARSVK